MSTIPTTVNIAPRGMSFAITVRPPSWPAELPPKLLARGWSIRSEAEATCSKLPATYQGRVVLVDELRVEEVPY